MFIKIKLRIASVTFIYIFSFAQNNFASNTLFAKNEALKKLNNQIQILQNNISSEKSAQTDFSEALKETELKVAVSSKGIFSINRALQFQKNKLTILENDHVRFTQQLSKQREILAEQVRVLYEQGNLQEIKLLLNQENIDTLNRRLTYYRYLSQNKMEMINQIKITLMHLEENTDAMFVQQNNLQKLLSLKKNELDKLKADQMERKQLIISLNKELQTKEQKLQELLSNQKSLQDVITKLQIENLKPQLVLPSKIIFQNLKGKLPWPAQGKIVARFNSKIGFGDQHLTGVVINTQRGTVVRAIAAGKVLFANWLRGFGLLVIINHDDGFMSLYGRNQFLNVNVGEKVRPNQPIGLTGNSGGFAHTSLYFEIRKNGLPLNPSAWCR